jgi:hypothetical protein
MVITLGQRLLLAVMIHTQLPPRLRADFCPFLTKLLLPSEPFRHALIF